jgi:hypothetical protein
MTSSSIWLGKHFSDLHPLLQQLHLNGETLSGNVKIEFGRRLAHFIGHRIAKKLNVPTAEGKHSLAMTGCHIEEFNHLLPYFTKALKHSNYTLEGKERQNQSTNYLNSPLPSSQDRLYFILVYFKQYPTQEMMGASFHLSQPKVNLWIHFLSPY